MKSFDTSWRSWTARAVASAFAVLIGLAMAVPDADAARMGGGRSFGRQSPNVTRQQSAPPSRDAAGQTAPTQQAGQRQAPPPAAQPQPTGNRWLGPIAGLAAGLGIAALLSHFGLGGALAEGLSSLILVGLLVLAAVWVWRMLRGPGNRPAVQRGAEPVYASAGVERVGSAYDPTSGTAMPGSVASLGSTPASAPKPWGVPAEFDTPGFIRSAKVNFIRLQEAWDARNLADIREFTTPEVFAELRMQIAEDKGGNNHTDVVELDAELLGIEESTTDYLASVKFSGVMRENDQSAAPVEEVWNLVKAKDGRSGWLLAGIQQIH